MNEHFFTCILLVFLIVGSNEYDNDSLIHNVMSTEQHDPITYENLETTTTNGQGKDLDDITRPLATDHRLVTASSVAPEKIDTSVTTTDATDKITPPQPTINSATDKAELARSTFEPTVHTALSITRNNAAIRPTNEPTVVISSHDTKSTAALISIDELTDVTTSYSSRSTNAMSPDNDQMGLTIVQSTPGDALIDLCNEYVSCPPKHKVDSWYCHCDDLCQLYNDCCKDYQATTYLPRQGGYRCLRTDQEKANFIGMFVVAVCPEHFENTTIINSCLDEDITSGPPVFDSNDDSRVFANQFCAICSNVKDRTPLPVQLYNLPSNVYLQELLGLGSVASIVNKYRRTKYRLLQKAKTKYRSCLSQDVEMSDKPGCQKYVNPLAAASGDGTERYYRNSFCLNESDQRSIESKDFTCFGGGLSFSNYNGHWQIDTLSVIFNFGQKNQDDENRKCTVWTEEVNDVCSYLQTYVNAQEAIEVSLQTSHDQTDDLLIQMGLVVMWAHIVPEETKLLGTATISKAEEGRIVKVSMNLVIKKRCFADELKAMHQIIRERSFYISFKNGYNQTEFTRLSNSQGENYTTLKMFRMAAPVEIYFPYFGIKSTTRQRNGMCPNVTISLEMNGNNFEIFSFGCGQDEIPTDRSSVTADAIATYACFSLSIVAMVPLIIVNRRIDDVMTIPRTNLENIAISLILANSLFMAGIGMTSMPTVCYVIGIGLHYLFLAVFVFMTIGVFTAAIGVNRLREKRNIPQSQVNRTRLLLTLLGLSLSLVIVGTAVSVDRVGPPRWSAGYSDTACFPTRFPGNIAFFTGPMMLMVTIDTICIIKIIVQVERTKTETRKLLKISTMFDDLKMYLRLVVLGGVLWLIGIVAAVVGWDWLDFAFVLTCGLQGFFISVASLTTQDFKRTIKAMFERT